MDGRVNNGDFNRFNGKWQLTTFSKDKQPDPEAKSAGWRRKKAGPELVRMILKESFNSTKFKQSFAEHFNIPIEDLDDMSNECAILYAQLAKAVGKGDTFAFEALMTRAYGKPKETPPLEDYQPPAISIGTFSEGPSIANSENDDTET